MRGRLPLLFVALVVVEIWLLVAIGHRIGGLATFGLLLGGGVIGGAVARGAGRRALVAWQEASVTGVVPGEALAGSAMLVIAGVLLMIPGVVTDVAGLLLLVPPVRRALAGRVRHALESRLRSGVTSGLGASLGGGLGGFAAARAQPQARVIDVDAVDKSDDE